jgi:hypothetical protein
MAKKTKRIRPKVGDVLEVSLGDGMHAYAHIANHKIVVFYDYNDKNNLPLEDIVKLPIAFQIWVSKYVLTSGRWPRIGNIDSDVLSDDPYFYKQDIISGALAIYHEEFIGTNYERPAKLSEVKNLERAAVWDAHHVEDRLEAFFKNERSVWEEPIDISKVPKSQKTPSCKYLLRRLLSLGKRLQG